LELFDDSKRLLLHLAKNLILEFQLAAATDPQADSTQVEVVKNHQVHQMKPNTI
jgi:hypothetical protein